MADQGFPKGGLDVHILAMCVPACLYLCVCVCVCVCMCVCMCVCACVHVFITFAEYAAINRIVET